MNKSIAKHQFNNIPTVLVIFGATGDLVTKKIVPALFSLFQAGKLPKMLQIVGYSRRNLDDTAFKSHILGIINNAFPNATSANQEQSLEKFISHFTYQQGHFDDKAGYSKLAERLGNIDGEWKVCANKLFYLAVPPQDYEVIFNNLSESGLTIPCGADEGWTRVLVEKPFGKDLDTARKLDELLTTLFKEEQIYRIDHYLAKEMLQNIISFRFANNIFEANWNAKSIERIDIRLWETLGVESRGAFYDGVGALRDVGQNHALQMLALITMDNPGLFTADAIRTARTAILKQIVGPQGEDCRTSTFRSQYMGFTEITGVDSDSKTETFFKAKLTLQGQRWQGVPVYIEGGKRMNRVLKEVVVSFKHPDVCFCPSDQEHFQDKVVFRFDPEEYIKIDVISKKPGLDLEVEQKSFNLPYRNIADRKQYVEEYEKLLLDAFVGDQTLFVSTAEVRAMWAVIDPIINAWKKNATPLKEYAPDSDEAIIEADKLFDANELAPFAKSIGIIGMGKMGGNMAKRLAEKGWNVVGYQRDQEELQNFVPFGITPAKSIADLVSKLASPRIIVLMLPAGAATHEVLLGKSGVSKLVNSGDYLIDASNNYYEDSKKHYQDFKDTGINFVDMGVSGGPSGARNGACLMIGGSEANFKYLLPLYQDLAQDGNALEFFAGPGAGHFVKMVHNGIEYGMMQSIAEGFNLLQKSPYQLDVRKITSIYQHGSVIESRLVGWLAHAYDQFGPDLGVISGAVEQNGEGLWTVTAAGNVGVDVASIKLAVDFRIASQKSPSYTGQILSAIRHEFGGHSVIIK